MTIEILPDRPACGRAAAEKGATLIRQAIAERGFASIIVATGASQLEMLDSLLQQEGISWDRVTAFHLDEYIGLPISHPASFRSYLWRRFHQRLPVPLQAFHYVNGTSDPSQECLRLERIIRGHHIDVCFAGIGENGHLAFNDPPADFDTDRAYLIVHLDEACRRQQLGEGWFADLQEVPTRAISMSVQQIMRSQSIIVTAPDRRKAAAVRNSVEGPITNEVPASVLQRHPSTLLFLDTSSASLLEKHGRAAHADPVPA